MTEVRRHVEVAVEQPEAALPVRSNLACVVLAHTDPRHLQRLAAALAPFRVYLHCDVTTSGEVYDEMLAGLPPNCETLPRIRTGWARWENVEAELSGYRAALRDESITHVALLTGSDYPLAATDEIVEFLGGHAGRSIVRYRALPVPEWGWSGGIARLRYPHKAYRKHMLRFPIPRRIPGDVVPTGGSQVKVLAREHVKALLDVVDTRPDLVAFWRRTWIADETFVGTILNSPRLVAGFPEQHVNEDLWWIGWTGGRQKSPPWLRAQDLQRLVAARRRTDAVPALFARKFSTSVDTGVLDEIDERLRLHKSPPG
jgi:hypothetical protein